MARTFYGRILSGKPVPTFPEMLIDRNRPEVQLAKGRKSPPALDFVESARLKIELGHAGDIVSGKALLFRSGVDSACRGR